MTPGERLSGRYEVKRATRKSTCWEGLDLQDGARCLIAQVPRHEAERLLALVVPGMAAVLAVVQREDDCFLVSAYPEGSRLADLSPPVSADEIVDCGLEILNPLSVLHQQDPPLVHGSVRPETVFLSDESAPFRLLAPCFPPRRRGSPYDAPEVDWGAATPSSDVYSVGLLMVYYLTGQRPSMDPLPSLLITAPDLDLHLATAVDKAVSSDPARRYPSASELREELQKWWDENDHEVRTPPPPPAASRTASEGSPTSKTWGPTAAVAAGLVLCCLLAFMAFGRQKTPPAAISSPSTVSLVTPSPGPASPTPTATESPTPSPTPDLVATPQPMPTSGPSTTPTPTPAPTRTTGLPEPGYPVKTYPKATPRIPGDGHGTANPSAVARQLSRPDLGIDLTVPPGWEVRRNSPGPNKVEISLENLQPTPEDPFAFMRLHVDTSTNPPSKIGRSFRLKKTTERWLELRHIPGFDQVYLRGGEVEALAVRRLPYYEFRYVVIRMGAPRSNMGQTETAAEAQKLLGNVKLK